MPETRPEESGRDGIEVRVLSLPSILLIGFLLGVRHATNPDHVVAVATLVTRERTLRAAAPIGAVWGLGHTATIIVVGGAIVVFGVVIPPRLGLTMKLSVGVMLVLLGALNLAAAVRQRRARAHGAEHEAVDVALARLDRRFARSTAYRLARPLATGIVHGLAGSAAVALLVLGTIHDPAWAIAYLSVFGVGTIAGMCLITTAMAMPFAYAAPRFARLHGALGLASGIVSVAFGFFLVYQLGFVQGLFTDHPVWTPQ